MIVHKNKLNNLILGGSFSAFLFIVMKKDYSQNIFFELSDRAYQRWTDFSTSFLSLDKLAEFNRIKGSLKSNFIVTGGIPDAERKIVIFSMLEPEFISSSDFLACIVISPLDEKFAEVLTHRNYLGAIMNLGITRDSIGDIFVKGKTAYVICLKVVANYLKDNLKSVNHTFVKTAITNDLPQDLKIKLKEVTVSCASGRIDLVISKLYGLSRRESFNLFEEKGVFVNDRIMENNSYVLRSNDIVSVSGYGRFCFLGEIKQSKKGNLVFVVKKYI